MTFEEYQNLLLKIDFNDKPCPVENMFLVLSGKWNLRVLFELTKSEQSRFGELKKNITGITNTMLSTTLKSLEAEGLVTRTQFNEIPPHVEYSLSAEGKDLYPIFLAMLQWLQKYRII